MSPMKVSLEFTEEMMKSLDDLKSKIEAPSSTQIRRSAFEFVKRARETGEPALAELNLESSGNLPEAEPALEISSVIKPLEKKSEGMLVKRRP